MVVLRRRVSPEAYRGVTRAALVLLCFIVVSGALVRLSGSGLGCSDWPNCEQGELVAPLEYHAMVEFVNRVVTGLVSVAVILAVLGSLARTPRRRDLTRLSIGLVGGVVAQIVLGGIVVLVGLEPPFVMGHFLVSMVLVAIAVVLHRRAGDELRPPVPIGPAVSPRVITLVRAVFGLTCLVLVLGTVVTATGPHGGDETAERFDLSLRLVTRVHSGAVWAMVAATIGLCAVASRRARTGDRASETLRRAAATLLVLEAGQGAIGYLQYFTDVPAELVALHVIGATATFVGAVRLLVTAGERPGRDDPIDGDRVETSAALRPLGVG